MLFNSLEFLIFLPIVFCLYWFVFNKNLFFQNLLILFASYLFYGWWDYRFLSLIIFSTVVDFIIGKKIHMSKDIKLRKMYLILSLATNLGILGFFKYFNFFIDSFIDLVALTGYGLENQWTLKIILPVGISFYTFQTLSYTIDIYRKQLTPTTNFISFAAFVAFFPQLVAGPIERAKNLLPQMNQSRKFNYQYSKKGIRLIILGFFKKIVIADNCARIVDIFYANPNDYNGIVVIVATLLFTIQIYGDFSGYSDIAIGVARLFGIKLNRNFNSPYKAASFTDFWRRWHISLSSWFRDYVYIPLGGSRVSNILNYRNLLITFIISGFWHGANYTFLIWGLLHGILLIIEKFLKDINFSVNINHYLKILCTFMMTNITWIFFRSDNLSQALVIIKNMFNLDFNLEVIKISFRGFGVSLEDFIFIFIAVILLFFVEFFEKNLKKNTFFMHPVFQYLYLQLLLFLIIFYSTKGDLVNFIYFQF